MKTYEVLSRKRRLNSTNGNPRYAYILRDEKGETIEANTARDHSFVYALTGNETALRVEMHETKRGNVITHAEEA